MQQWLDDDGDGTIDTYEQVVLPGDEDETDPDMAPHVAMGLMTIMMRSLISLMTRDAPRLVIAMVDPEVMPLCSDGIDNDRDGAIDCPEDQAALQHRQYGRWRMWTHLPGGGSGGWRSRWRRFPQNPYASEEVVVGEAPEWSSCIE